VHGKLSHHALGDRHESGAKSDAREPACFSRIVPAALESTLHVRLARRTVARRGWPQCDYLRLGRFEANLQTAVTYDSRGLVKEEKGDSVEKIAPNNLENYS
jgi:hypothetical protein